MSLPPCCRFHPAEVKEPLRSDFGSPCCLRPPVAGSAFGATHFRGHIRVYFHYGPAARRLPEGDVVDRLRSSGFPPPGYPNYGASDLAAAFGRYPALTATANPSVTLSPSIDFPVEPVIRSTLLRRFRAGTRRASPVARHVLATVLSLPPRRSEGAASVRFRLPMLPSPSSCGLGLRGYAFSRPHSRLLSLRPGGSSSPRGRRCR